MTKEIKSERLEQIAKLAREFLTGYKMPIFVGSSAIKEDIVYTQEMFNAAWKLAEKFIDYCDNKIDEGEKYNKSISEGIIPATFKKGEETFSDAPAKVFDRDDTTDESEVLGYCLGCGNTVSKQQDWHIASLPNIIGHYDMYCSKKCLNKASLEYKKGEAALKSIVDEDHLEALEFCARCGLKLSGRDKECTAWGNKMLFPNRLFCCKECLDEESQELRDDVKRVNEFRN